MPVFDELNKGPKRLEDPEERQADHIRRDGSRQNLKRKSSGVTLSTYKRSIQAVYVIAALAAVGGIGYLCYFAISAFIGE